MEKQVIVNGQVLLEKNNLVYLRNKAGVQQVFDVVEIDNGYVILEPLDARRFGNDMNEITKFCAAKPVVKGIIQTTK